MTNTEVIGKALALDRGSVEYKCALQVNTYGYYANFENPSSGYSDEFSYNQDLVKELLKERVQVIAIMDHFDAKSAESLIALAESEGIFVFPGFEAVSKEGVHLLCLFEGGTSIETLISHIGWFDLKNPEQKSPISGRTVEDILQQCRAWGGISVAAHVCNGGGLFETLNGQAAINVWTDQHLLACSISGAIQDSPQSHRDKLKNKNPDYFREHPVCIINAKDLSTPYNVSDPGMTTWISMSEVSIEGLRQAFLDPESRIRLNSDSEPKQHNELVALSWEGGFLDGCGIHLSSRLNVLIGGPGSGKSTVVESIRFVLDKPPLVSGAFRQHEEFVRDVLGVTCKVHLLLRTYYPSMNEYLITRKPGEKPLVHSYPDGLKLELHPADLMSGFESYGQHELSELSRDDSKLTTLLARFIPDTQNKERDSKILSGKLSKSKIDILATEQRIDEIVSEIQNLPVLQEKSKRFEKAGLKGQFSEIEQLSNEDPIFSTHFSNLTVVDEKLQELGMANSFDLSELSEGNPIIGNSPRQAILLELLPVLDGLQADVAELLNQIAVRITAAQVKVEVIRDKWVTEKESIEKNHNTTINKLTNDGINVRDYIGLLESIAKLEPISKELNELEAFRADQYSSRNELLETWSDALTEEVRELERAAKKVNKGLKGTVEVNIHAHRNRQPIVDFLEGQVSGRIAETVRILENRENLSVRDFAATCRSGTSALMQEYGLTDFQASLISTKDSKFFLELEEIRLESTAEVLLNVGNKEEQKWKSLSNLSTGQKATAILLLLLLESSEPLIVDQPEDDLANRFITERIVPDIKSAKMNRQFLMATHDPNIPVLADAEQIMCMESPQVVDDPIICGAIDKPKIRIFVEKVLEGGKSAFETRRRKYGF